MTLKIAQDFSPRKIIGMDIDSKLVKIAWRNLYRFGETVTRIQSYVFTNYLSCDFRDHFPVLAPDGRPFPLSITQARGPMTIPLPTAVSSAQDVEGETGEGTSTSPARNAFPHNVEFVHVSPTCFHLQKSPHTHSHLSPSVLVLFQSNYVPMSDSALENQLPEFDVILALSLTKWIHLNWGDEGIKRFFRKVYLHLRPGGKFIVEPQPFSSYARKKKVSVSFNTMSWFLCYPCL